MGSSMGLSLIKRTLNPRAIIEADNRMIDDMGKNYTIIKADQHRFWQLLVDVLLLDSAVPSDNRIHFTDNQCTMSFSHRLNPLHRTTITIIYQIAGYCNVSSVSFV